jgi:hypothetical protein
MIYRCPKCREKVTEKKYESQTIHFCENKNCNINDGIYRDKSNLLDFGKGEIVIHQPSQDSFCDEMVDYYCLRENEKRKYMEEARRWQHKYYQTWDFKVKQMWSNLLDYASKIKKGKPFKRETTDIIKYDETEN